MNKLTRTLALLAALAMTATAFVGCGDDKDSSSSSAATTVAEESSEETSAAEDKNVEEAFIELIKSILESYEKNNLEKGNEEKVAKGVTLKSDNDNKENKKCC